MSWLRLYEFTVLPGGKTTLLYHQSIRYHNNIVTMAKLGYAAPPAKPENRKYAISESPIQEINVTHH
jgi:hypothetical protein